MSGYVLPYAGWSVSLDGQDLTATMDPLLLSLTIAEKRGGEADQLDIVLSDAAGTLAIPRPGAKLRVSLGWLRGSDLPVGLIDKGLYRVDEAGWSGGMQGDAISIRARSADFTDAFRVRRERGFVGKSVRAVLDAIAGDNGLTARVDATLGARTIPALGFGPKSDAALLAELGRRFDAAATVKAGMLIFAPIGAGKSASGKALPAFAIDRAETVSAEYSRVQREDYGGVEAQWHDKASGTRKTAKSSGSGSTSGGGGGGKPKRLRKVYANEADAQQAATAAASRAGRAVAKMSMDLAYGRPDIYPESPITLTGFKDEIMARKWIVAEASHSMDGSRALVTKLELEGL